MSVAGQVYILQRGKLAGGVAGNEKAFAIRGPIHGQEIVPVFQRDRAWRLTNGRFVPFNSAAPIVVPSGERLQFQPRAGCSSFAPSRWGPFSGSNATKMKDFDSDRPNTQTFAGAREH